MHQVDRSDTDEDASAAEPSDVLHELIVSAVDALYDHLKDQKSLRAVRQTCRGLRDAVDGRLCDACITVTAAALREWKQGQVSVLNRWPRCSRVRVRLGKDIPADSVGRALALPFAGVSVASRNSITNLSVSFGHYFRYWDLEPIIADTAQQLPMLRRLEFAGLPGRQSERGGNPQPAATYTPPPPLPHLEYLVLPDWYGLHCVPDLAAGGSLRVLTISNPYHISSTVDLDEVAAVIPQLASLQELIVQSGITYTPTYPDGCAVLQRLLRCLPPTVHTLHLTAFQHAPTSPWRVDASLRLRQGRVVAVALKRTAGQEHVTVAHVAALAGEVLLPCLPEGQQLERLNVECLPIPCSAEGALSPEQLQRLRQLASRCVHTEVGELVLLPPDAGCWDATRASATQAGELAELVRLLGHPAKVKLVLPRHAPSLVSGIRLDVTRPPSRAAVAVGGDAGGMVRRDGGREQSAASPPPALLPSATDLVQAALQRMAAAGAVAVGAVAAEPSSPSVSRGAAPAASSFNPGRCTSTYLPTKGLRLLRGPLVSGLLERDWDMRHNPDYEQGNLLVRWWRQVRQHAPESFPSGCVYLALPIAGVVLVGLEDERRAAALETAVMEAGGAGGAAAGDEGLEVAAVGLPAVRAWRGYEIDLRCRFLMLLQQVMQEAWDSHVRPSGNQQLRKQQHPGSSAARAPLAPELLPWLLDVRDQVLLKLPRVKWLP